MKQTLIDLIVFIFSEIASVYLNTLLFFLTCLTLAAPIAVVSEFVKKGVFFEALVYSFVVVFVSRLWSLLRTICDRLG